VSSFRSTEAWINPQPIDSNSTTAQVPLGTIIRAHDKETTAYGSGEFIYAKGVASTVVGSVVTISSDDYATALASADAIGTIGTAMSACVASEYGWYQISGKGVAKVKASFADNGDCYLTSTAGSVDDANVAGDYISGMKGASAIDTPSTGLAEVEMSRPSVANGLDD
jgi:hypothetical protein